MMNGLLEAEYFGASNNELFGLYRKPDPHCDRQECVLICNPSPHEMFRAHWSRNQISMQLAMNGFHSLCFDYFGTGDSYGESMHFDLDRWRADVSQALFFLRKKVTSAGKVHVVGIRLGAALAIQALSAEKIDGFYLWDPVFKGAPFLAALKKMHLELLRHDPYRPPFFSPESMRGQLLGYVHTNHFEHQLAALDLPLDASATDRIRLVVAQRPGASPEGDVVDGPLWDNWRYVNQRVFSSLVVKKLVQAISVGGR